MSTENTKEYSEKYSEDNFWNKIKKFAKKAGKTVIEKALTLYYVARDSDTPMWAKTTIYGALGYFISPVDVIPDIIPVTGYSDDLGVLAAAIATVAVYIKDEHVEKAKDTLKRWFS